MTTAITHDQAAAVQGVRYAQSRVAFTQVASGIKAWLEKCGKRDTRRQHTSQLAAIRSVLGAIETRLNQDLKALTPQPDPGQFYEACALFERRVVWLDRIWRFFEGKFEQRENGDLGRMLSAADEVVWSCYSQVFDKAKALGWPVERGPAPLPFVEARYSPEAFPAELVPPDLKSEVEIEVLREHLNRMPAPVVRVPPVCTAAPWWLVILGHETGHHVQYDLVPQRGLVAAYRAAIEAAVRDRTGSDEEAMRWGRWSKEIFADVFSVFCMGSWAVWAMTELELKPSERMGDPRDDYPPPATRLTLLALVADAIGGSAMGTQALRGLLNPKPDAAIEAVLDVALGKLSVVGHSLGELCDFHRDDFENTVPGWRDKLHDRSDDVPLPDLKAARLTVSAALAAWERLASEHRGEALEEARMDLARRTVNAVAATAVEGERDAEAAPEIGQLADDIAAALWQAAG
jgi:hypothetical protein